MLYRHNSVPKSLCFNASVIWYYLDNETRWNYDSCSTIRWPERDKLNTCGHFPFLSEYDRICTYIRQKNSRVFLTFLFCILFPSSDSACSEIKYFFTCHCICWARFNSCFLNCIGSSCLQVPHESFTSSPTFAPSSPLQHSLLRLHSNFSSSPPVQPSLLLLHSNLLSFTSFITVSSSNSL